MISSVAEATPKAIEGPRLTALDTKSAILPWPFHVVPPVERFLGGDSSVTKRSVSRRLNREGAFSVG